MKYAILLILTLILMPSAIAQQQYTENIYVFSLDFASGVPADDECAAAVARLSKRLLVSGINPTFGVRFKINSVDTSAKRGKVTNMAVEEIGEMLVCQDGQTNPPEMNLIPIYNEITIGSRTFRVEGAGIHPAFPDILPGGLVQYTPPGYPSDERRIVNINGSVMSGIPGEKGGSYMESALVGGSGEFDDGLTDNAIHVLRVLIPVKP
ncbi:MAG: hypothetical protein V7709_18620 [Halioglobus sp.]